MARTTTITDEQILQAAREAFIEEGFSIQTSKIAKRAGVSEGTLFKRYPTKAALFLAAIQIEYPPVWHTMVQQLAGEGEIRTNLVKICYAIMCQMAEMIPRIVAAYGGPKPDADNDPLRELPVMDRDVLAEYFRIEIEAGRVFNTDPQFLADSFFGFVTSHIFKIGPSKEPIDKSGFLNIAENTIDLIWNGIAPRE